MSGRLPFRAGDLRSDAPKGAPKSDDPDRPLSVSALAGLIDGAIRECTPPSVRVIGEVSGFRDRTHWYFDLKDAGAVVQCVVFASSARRLPFTPEDGQEVVASGRVDYYAKSGKVSLIATRLEPVGAGAMDVAFQKLVEELRALGWFAEERKRRLPGFPRRVAVVTSRSSAAYQDVLDTARRRMRAVDIVLVDVRVQGDMAAREIVDAVREIGARHIDERLDAIILTRGGGSKDDLWCFNDRDLAQAIIDSPIPVVAAIGHETDTTIAELVADLRAATPTQAAMRLFPDGLALGDQVNRQSARLTTALQSRLRAHQRELHRLGERPFFRRPASILEGPRSRLEADADRMTRQLRERVHRASLRLERLAGRLDRLRPDRVAMRQERARTARLTRAEERLAAAMTHLLTKHESRLEGAGRELAAVSPMAVLERGYSVTLDAEGRAVRSVGQVGAGETIETRLVDGSVRSVVSEGGPGTTKKPRPARRSRPKGNDEADQMDLFGGKG